MTLLQKTQILSKHHHSRGSKADHLAFFMVLLFSMWGCRKRGLITTTDAYDSCAFCQEPGMYRKKPTGSNATQAHLCNCRAWAHQQLRCSKLGYKPPAYQQMCVLLLGAAGLPKEWRTPQKMPHNLEQARATCSHCGQPVVLLHLSVGRS